MMNKLLGALLGICLSISALGVGVVGNIIGVTGSDGTETITTKGDVLTRSSTGLARIGVGANGTVLMAASGETTGLQWSALPGGGDFLASGAVPMTGAMQGLFLANGIYYQAKQSTAGTTRNILGFSTDTLLVGATSNPMTLQGDAITIQGPGATGSIKFDAGTTGFLKFIDTDVTNSQTGLTNVYARLQQYSTTLGGVILEGFTDSAGATAYGLVLNGYTDTAAPTATTPIVQFRASKTNSAGGETDLAATETVFQFSGSGGTTDYLTITGDGHVGIGDSTPTEGKLVLASGSATLAALAIEAPITTTGNLVSIGGTTADTTLTTGSLAVLKSNSANTSDRSLVQIINDNAAALDADTLYLQNDGAAATGANAIRIATGKISSADTTTAVSACGTTPAITGSDINGKITIGTGATTSCTVTFGSPYATNAPACVASINSTTITLGVATTASVLTITSSADMNSKVLSYICMGN